MLRGEIDAAAADEPEHLLDAYAERLEAAVAAVGMDAVVAETGLDRSTVQRAADGDVRDITLAEAASILAAAPDRREADAIAAEARNILLLGMTTAVLDVESLASELDGAMEPKELQQKVEGRHPMTLAEYAAVHYHLREHTE